MDNKTLKEIVEWDTVNWSRAIKFWDTENIDFKDKKVLELGSRNGGLSLYFALKGAYVVCSDLNMPNTQAKSLHKKYGVDNRISYEAVDATNINYINSFDIICFKSVLGGIGYNDSKVRQQLAINQIFKALKRTKHLLFVENLVASPLHIYFRKRFIKWGGKWRYLTIDELKEMTKDFSKVKFKTFGFFGCFGRNNFQRNILGYLDCIIDRIVPEYNRYIGAFIIEK